MLVAVGGAVGAVLRFGVQSATVAWSVPWGTLIVNVGGSLAIGALLGALADAPWFESVGRPLLLVGLLGAFTTFSAFSADTLVLSENGRFGAAVAYAGATVTGCLAAAWLGYWLAGGLR